jgi:hypothetical protein
MNWISKKREYSEISMREDNKGEEGEEEEEKCESEHQSLKRPRDESFRSNYAQEDDDFSSIIVDDLGSGPPSNPKIVHP